jgi:hypothetical protein
MLGLRMRTSSLMVASYFHKAPFSKHLVSVVECSNLNINLHLCPIKVANVFNIFASNYWKLKFVLGWERRCNLIFKP